MTPSPRRPAARLAVVQLEDRATPAVTHTFNAGALVVNSDAAGDAIKIVRAGPASDYYYTANGTPSVTFAGVSSITVNGNDGADSIDLSGTATPIAFANAKMSTSASGAFNASYAPAYAFNGAGLSGDTHTATLSDGYGGKTMWLSTNQAANPAGVDGQYLQIGLGNTYNVSKLQFWNYNQFYNPSATVRGIKTADIQTSLDGVTFTTAKANVTFAQAPGLDTYNTPDTVSLPTAPAAKFVRILIHSNYGTDAFGNYVGASEVKLFGDAATPVQTGLPVTPTAAAASTTFTNMSPANAVNGAGLFTGFSPPTHDTNWQTAWLSTNQANVAGQYLQADLGAVTSLNALRLWNYNQNYYGSYSGRGMKNVDIQYSTDGVSFTTALSTVIPQAPAASAYTGVEIAVPNTPVRYVRIVAQSNWNNNVADAYGNYVGLSEVRFLAAVAAPPTPLGVTVNGGTGNDTITAGAGNDTLSGGADADTFVFPAGFAAAAPNTTTVTDFANGLDRLDLRPVGVNAYNTGGTSLVGQGGTATQNGLNVDITLPPSAGTRTIKLLTFVTALLDDTDFVP